MTEPPGRLSAAAPVSVWALTRTAQPSAPSKSLPEHSGFERSPSNAQPLRLTMSPLNCASWNAWHSGSTQSLSRWPTQAKDLSGPYFLVIQARSWWFMSKDVMHGMCQKSSIVGHFSTHSSKVVVPSCWSKTYRGRKKDVVGAATVADTAVAASAPRTKEAAAAPARTVLTFTLTSRWRSGLSAAAGMVE